MHKLDPPTRRHALRMFASVPWLLLPGRSAQAAPPRRWTVTGARVEALDSLDAAMQRLLQRYGVRAGALAVARAGSILFARGYTWAEPDYPVTQPNSPFRLASVSKAFTAAVIYELLQAKKLELGLPVFPWLGLDRAALSGQTVDPRLATITVQQLINHRGGWDARAANFDPVFSMRRIARRLGLRVAPSSRDIARFMVGEPLQFTPGTQERYSNFGYVMLGLVAEKAGAAAFHDLVREQVAAPLGVERVFRARTRRDLRLPGEGFYDQPGNGLTPEFPDRDVRVPLAYGGEGWLTESMTAGGGLAAGAGAVARTIGHYAVWGLGLRRPNQNWARSGGMAGTSSLAISRPDGLDLCFVVNTRNFGGAKAMGETSSDINRALDSAGKFFDYTVNTLLTTQRSYAREILILAQRGRFPETILKAERGVASRDCGANRSAGGPGPRPIRPYGLARAGRSSAPVPLPEAAARVPGRKPPRRSAERASRLQRDGPRFAHAVVAPRTRDIREKSAPVGAPPPPRFGVDAKERRRTPTHKRGAGMKKTALCGVARLPAPPHPEEARRAVSKDGRPLIGPHASRRIATRCSSA